MADTICLDSSEEVEPPQPPEYFKCSNCLKKTLVDSTDNPFTKKVTGFSLKNEIEGGTAEISIMEALITLFNIDLENSSYLYPSSLLNSNLEVCFECSTHLADLYKNYQEFLQLSEKNSDIYEIIRLSLRAQTRWSTSPSQDIPWATWVSEPKPKPKPKQPPPPRQILDNKPTTPPTSVSNGRVSQRLNMKRARKGGEANNVEDDIWDRSVKRVRKNSSTLVKVQESVRVGRPIRVKEPSVVQNSESDVEEEDVAVFNGYLRLPSEPQLPSKRNPNSKISQSLVEAKESPNPKTNGWGNAHSSRAAQNNPVPQISEVERTFQGFNCLNCGLVEPIVTRMVDHLVLVHAFEDDLATTLCSQAANNLAERQRREKLRLSSLKKEPLNPSPAPAPKTMVQAVAATTPTEARRTSRKIKRTMSRKDYEEIYPSIKKVQVRKGVRASVGMVDKPFQCISASCNMSFVHKPSMIRHFRKSHPVEAKRLPRRIIGLPQEPAASTSQPKKKPTPKIKPEPKPKEKSSTATTPAMTPGKKPKSPAQGKKLNFLGSKEKVNVPKPPATPASNNNVGLAVGKSEFCCNFCSAKFQKSYYLNQHLLTHRQDRQFFCDNEGCGKSFTEKSNLRRHKSLCHVGKKSICLRCYICQNDYVTKYVLVNHLVFKHKLDRKKAQLKVGVVGIGSTEKRVRRKMPVLSKN